MKFCLSCVYLDRKTFPHEEPAYGSLPEVCRLEQDNITAQSGHIDNCLRYVFLDQPIFKNKQRFIIKENQWLDTWYLEPQLPRNRLKAAKKSPGRRIKKATQVSLDRSVVSLGLSKWRLEFISRSAVLLPGQGKFLFSPREPG